ncbi:DUF262 domain-containing protein [Rossellomorea sp. KS-H15a]|uniref:DUF262 domain-containing protein n=1 Tax=Rossellomorea sp. KS-H15a TaxID=2963940 RepID=UPI0020C69577|nr:DUF262 domain-containing protein [Rossellomorea sp. KS-H15a]UTE76759.1 DUF262 domain-containing protein [Rossellomorea sp. KS-H15a]
MRLIPSDPDIYTIVQRIKNGDIDLQPDFQRGEVWSEVKKKRLIDSILRDWHVPPIHVVEVIETRRQDVLDGQQRLVAIRDFIDGKITIDGFIEPNDINIQELHGFKYNDLPVVWRRKFEQFTIRLFKITDYRPEEPGELFFRLNQPTNLTSAEQRNAFFGPAREQIKSLVESFSYFGLSENVLKFSNSRMAYDDIIAKLCFTLEIGTLYEKINANDITNKYRSQDKFDNLIITRVQNSIKALGQASSYIDLSIRFNKATLFSWLCFLSEIENENFLFENIDVLGEYISYFEIVRKTNKTLPLSIFSNDYGHPDSFEEHLLGLFNDRASSRVANVTSVVSRDLIIWIFFYKFLKQRNIDPDYFDNNKASILEEIITEAELKFKRKEIADLINDVVSKYSWGRYI